MPGFFAWENNEQNTKHLDQICPLDEVLPASKNRPS
ncbi:hypothetical protein cgp_2663 [Corynebacterium glutamicum MB001]|nr:hypothetical protein cgp_2663 [Corynebacterium glutamicum MB001]QYO74393.1 hypothetical protein cgisf_2663 [Corynebacterium glutamicum]